MCNKCEHPPAVASAKDYKYCAKCGKDLVVKEALEAFEFNPVTGAAKYFVSVTCPDYKYPVSTTHTSTGYNLEKERKCLVGV